MRRLVYLFSTALWVTCITAVVGKRLARAGVTRLLHWLVR